MRLTWRYPIRCRPNWRPSRRLSLRALLHQHRASRTRATSCTSSRYLSGTLSPSVSPHVGSLAAQRRADPEVVPSSLSRHSLPRVQLARRDRRLTRSPRDCRTCRCLHRQHGKSRGLAPTSTLRADRHLAQTANVVALSVIQGFCTALDTLCPQAFTSRPKDTSLYALRTLVILAFIIIPQTVIFWNSEWLLLLLRQDPDVAKFAGLYLKVREACVRRSSAEKLILLYLAGVVVRYARIRRLRVQSSLATIARSHAGPRHHFNRRGAPQRPP